RSSPPTRSSPGSSARGRVARLTVSILIEPRHLDFFQGGFVGGLGVVGEAVELGDPAVQVGEADGQRVDVGKLFAERDPEVLGVLPRELHLGISTPTSPRTTAWQPSREWIVNPSAMSRRSSSSDSISLR